MDLTILAVVLLLIFGIPAKNKAIKKYRESKEKKGTGKER